MKFKDLSMLAKCRAITNYVDGFIDTHGDIDGLTHAEVSEILTDDLDDDYDKMGHVKKIEVIIDYKYQCTDCGTNTGVFNCSFGNNKIDLCSDCVEVRNE